MYNKYLYSQTESYPILNGLITYNKDIFCNNMGDSHEFKQY